LTWRYCSYSNRKQHRSRPQAPAKPSALMGGGLLLGHPDPDGVELGHPRGATKNPAAPSDSPSQLRYVPVPDLSEFYAASQGGS